MKYTALFSLLLVPAVSHAQSLQAYAAAITQYLFSAIVPFMLGLAFLFVVVNIIRFFVIDSANSEGRENAKRYIIYSVMAFVLVIIFWGIIVIIATATGLDGTGPVTPDIPGFPASGTGAGAGCPPGGTGAGGAGASGCGSGGGGGGGF